MARQYRPMPPPANGATRLGRPPNDDQARIAGVLFAVGAQEADVSVAVNLAAADVVAASEVAAASSPRRKPIITPKSARDRISQPVRAAIAAHGPQRAAVGAYGRLALDILGGVAQRDGEQRVWAMLVDSLALAIAWGDPTMAAENRGLAAEILYQSCNEAGKIAALQNGAVKTFPA